MSKVDHAAQLRSLPSAGPIIMGILNVTPDSFSDGGRSNTVERAVANAERMLSDGAHIIDVGGESSRPGAHPVSSLDELARVLPVIERLAGRCVISIDTAKPEVADAALQAGASIVNDITASLEDVAGAHCAGWVAMHMQGSPQTMQNNPSYADVVEEVLSEFDDYVARAERAGVSSVWVDPGFGFGKSDDHNLALVRSIALASERAPVLIGVSRKRSIGKIHAASDKTAESGQTAVGDRVEGSVMAAVWSWARQAHIVRTHDVRVTALAAQFLRKFERK